MENFLNPDKADLIRETLMVLFGLFARWIELRKYKNRNDDKF
jgi:hypothetical protein